MRLRTGAMSCVFSGEKNLWRRHTSRRRCALERGFFCKKAGKPPKRAFLLFMLDGRIVLITVTTVVMFPVVVVMATVSATSFSFIHIIRRLVLHYRCRSDIHRLWRHIHRA